MTTAGRARPAMTLVATGLGLFMIFLDATIVNVALPSIQHDFRVGENELQWVVAAYSVTMAMFMMTSATISDAHGRRRAYVMGIVLFSGASLGCGLAPGVGFLDAMRAIQGVGAAVVSVASLALVGAANPDPPSKARAVGIWAGIAAIGLAIGPTLGGVLTDSVGWRWIFLVNPVVGAAVIVLSYRFVRESADPTRRSFDPVGQLLFITGIGALTFALVQAPVYGFSSALVIGLLVGALVVLSVFVWFERRSRDPMMDVGVFVDLPYTAAIVTVFSVLFCAYGTLLVITQYFQNVRDYSAQEAGALLLAFSLPGMVMSPISGRLAARFGGRRPTLLGTALVGAACATLAVGAGRELLITVTGLTFLGFGLGLAVAPANAVAMASISPDRSGMASGILSAQRALGSTAGFAIMGSILALVVSFQLPHDLEPVIPHASARSQVVADVVDAANPNAVPSVIGPRPGGRADITKRAEVVAAADEAFNDGIRAAELVGLGVALGAFMLGWIGFPRTEPGERDDESAEERTLATSVEI